MPVEHPNHYYPELTSDDLLDAHKTHLTLWSLQEVLANRPHEETGDLRIFGYHPLRCAAVERGTDFVNAVNKMLNERRDRYTAKALWAFHLGHSTTDLDEKVTCPQTGWQTSLKHRIGSFMRAVLLPIPGECERCGRIDEDSMPGYEIWGHECGECATDCPDGIF